MSVNRMCAPKTPVSTRLWRARAACTKVSNNCRPGPEGGGREAGPQALVGFRGQGELGHQEQIPLDLPQAQIHFPFSSAEYPVLKQTVEQPQGGCFVVGWAYSDQHQKSGAYAGDTLIVNINAGSGNALQQSIKSVSSPLNCQTGQAEPDAFPTLSNVLLPADSLLSTTWPPGKKGSDRPLYLYFATKWE